MTRIRTSRDAEHAFFENAQDFGAFVQNECPAFIFLSASHSPSDQSANGKADPEGMEHIRTYIRLARKANREMERIQARHKEAA